MLVDSFIYYNVLYCTVRRTGSGCSNRQLQRRKLPKTTVFPEFLMGWGLKAAEDIECRSLVMEYVGEVIDHQEVQRRMQCQRTYTPQVRCNVIDDPETRTTDDY